MSVDFDPLPAATMLANASRAGRQIAELPVAIRPPTLSDGYDVQAEFVRAMGAKAAGWKLAIGSPRARRESGLSCAIAGTIVDSQLFSAGAALRLDLFAPIIIEFEIAYIVNQDIRPDETIEDPTSVIAATRVAFELVRSRFVDRGGVGWPSFAADNGTFLALVLGPRIADDDIDAVVQSLRVVIDGEEKAVALTGDDFTAPLESLADLLAIARDRNFVVPKGSIVSTGTLSAPFTLSHPATVTAHYLDATLAFTLGQT